MKRYLITSTKYEGEVQAIYNSDGILLKIDFTAAKIAPELIAGFKRQLPVYSAELAESFKDNGTTIVEADFEITLDDFIREYPYKRNTHLLTAIWQKLPKTDQVIAYYAALEYRKYCDREKAWYKPKIAAAWLKNKEYLNDWKKM